MNWKLAIDTFGETYHFGVLHKNTLANDFYANVQLYDRFKRNHRMALCLKNIDTLREVPRESWDVRQAALPVYYLFPNVQLITGMGGPTLVRVYPDGPNPRQSHSQIDFYLDPLIQQAMLDPEMAQRYGEVAERMQGFADVIRDEDYVAAALAHLGAESGAQAKSARPNKGRTKRLFNEVSVTNGNVSMGSGSGNGIFNLAPA